MAFDRESSSSSGSTRSKRLAFWCSGVKEMDIVASPDGCFGEGGASALWDGFTAGCRDELGHEFEVRFCRKPAGSRQTASLSPG